MLFWALLASGPIKMRRGLAGGNPPRPPDERPPWAREQIVIAALVFAFGLVLGAGVAAWLQPPRDAGPQEH
jgi:hypothetical protein